MKNMFLNQKLAGCAIMIAGALLFGCTEEEVEPTAIQNLDIDTPASAIHHIRTVNFNNRTNGSTYTSSQADSDFGDVTGWSSGEGDPKIDNGALRIKLKRNVVGTSGGMESRVNTSDGTEYEMEYRIKFKTGFDWSRGGKCGWGFQVGDGVTGGRWEEAHDGKGGSLRAMWYAPSRGKNDTSGGDVFFRPYAYFMNMPEGSGVHWDKRYPSSGNSIQVNTWYKIKFYYKENTCNNCANGRLKMYVNGTLVVSKSNIRWANSTSKRKVKGMYFSVFRGGSQEHWKSTSDGYIRFDNVKWKRLRS